jgi:hypothetical protein
MDGRPRKIGLIPDSGNLGKSLGQNFLLFSGYRESCAWG